MWESACLKRIDYRVMPLLLALMAMSLLVIASTADSSTVKSQLQWFAIGWVVYFFFAGFDYRKLRSFGAILYIIILIMLVGLFFVSSIQNVHRWYRIPLIHVMLQPSEYAKLALVIALSCFLEKNHLQAQSRRVALKALGLVLIPFLLILKQPDLGTALVLFPIALVMFYFGEIHRRVVMAMSALGALGLIVVSLFFTGVLPHEEMRPIATKFIKEYQYERLSPNTYHQKAAQIAIGAGGLWGSGWKESIFTGGHFLPAAHTDSVFAAFAEEFGLMGVFFLLLFFCALLYCCFQVTAVASDRFGQLLSAGISAYLAMHILVNMGMMSGFLPITGVPLILVTYGGSSVLSTMMALGLLQSIYSRRYLFS